MEFHEIFKIEDDHYFSFLLLFFYSNKSQLENFDKLILFILLSFVDKKKSKTMIDTGYDEQIQYQAQQTFRADDAVRKLKFRDEEKYFFSCLEFST